MLIETVGFVFIKNDVRARVCAHEFLPEVVSIRTGSDDLFDGQVGLFRHETDDREDGESSEETGQTIDDWNDTRIPVNSQRPLESLTMPPSLGHCQSFLSVSFHKKDICTLTADYTRRKYLSFTAKCLV